MAEKVKITIDGQEHEVEAGKNLLQVCLDKELLIPHFCYHEAMGAVGACRLCAAMVAPAADKPARLEMTCMSRAADGMVVSVNDEYASSFRRVLIEQLMLNHPHDCPVCDEGGECMLQDMTVLSEHQHRRSRFAKRTWENQYLGPMIHHEMNRCITCYRCVRYYNDYALGGDLGAFGSRDRVYFGRVEDGVLESEFAGNLVDVCPTGVFTNKRFREVYSRPWDLSTSHSVCVNCSVGCNVLPGFRHNLLRRIKPIDNEAVNKFFMCDRGRYGGEYVNSAARLKSARVSGDELLTDEAIDAVAEKLQEIAKKHGPGSVAGIGSARASLEANAALVLLLKSLGGGKAAFFNTPGERETVRLAAALTVSREVDVPGLPEIEQADFILNLGGDLTGEAPMIDLSVRQSIRAHNQYYSVSSRRGKLEEFAAGFHAATPGTEADALRKILDAAGSASTSANGDFFAAAGQALRNASKPLILCSALHEDAALVRAAFDAAKSLSSGERKCSLAYYFPAANSLGVGLMSEDIELDSIWKDVDQGKVKALVILESNPAFYRETSARFIAAARKCEMVVTIDSLDNATTQASTAVLPCISHYQSFGTFLNYEGRAQRFDGLNIPGSVTFASSEILVRLILKSDGSAVVDKTDFHELYNLKPEMSGQLDGLRPGEQGLRVGGSKPASDAGNPQAGQPSMKLVPYKIYFAFGSEELSAIAPPISELAPAPVIELHPDDARAQNLKDGQHVDFSDEFGVTGKLRENPGLATGTIGLPVILTNAAATGAEVLT